MLSVSLVPRLWSSPPRTMGYCLCLPMSSAIINYNNNNNKNVINKQINLQKYFPQLARLFKAGQCVKNIKIECRHSLKPCLHKFCQIYLFIYLGLLILCFVIKVANENVLKLCVLVQSHRCKLWSLHLHDICKLFLGKGCLSGQWVCSRFL